MSKNIIYTLLGLVCFAFSCDSFLDRQPQSEILVEDFYKTENDLELGILSVYTALQHVDWQGSAWKITEIPSDNSQPGFIEPEATPIDNFTTNADNLIIYKFWQARYRLIALANVFIEKAPGANVSQSLAQQYIDEARFLRALAYFDLVRVYGGVPLHIKAPSHGQDFLLPRSSPEEVYELIRSDLLPATQTLPETRGGGTLGRATKGAALALLAKVELTTRNFAAARDYALAVINLGVYQLMPNVADNWEMPTADNNEEAVFQIQYAGCGPFNTGNALQGFYAPVLEDVTMGADGFSSIIPTGNVLTNPGTTLLDAFEEGDLREYHTVMRSGDHYPNINPEAGGYTYDGFASREGANIKKYVIGGGLDVCFLSTPQNGHILRYADVLLMLAEAAVQLGGGSSSNAAAVAAFNEVRVRAGLPTVESLNRDMVFHERRIELAFEGERWFDLLRMGAEEAMEIMILHGRRPTEERLLFPIPNAELQINPNLSQNPGY